MHLLTLDRSPMSEVPPTYEELLHSLQQLEQRFHNLEKAHSELLAELQKRLITIQESIDAGIHPRHGGD